LPLNPVFGRPTDPIEDPRRTGVQLTRVIIFAKDLEVMRQFYCEKMGLLPIPGSGQPGWIECDAGHTRVALHAIPASIAEGISLANPIEPREDNPVKLVFAVKDVEAERSRLVAQGVTMFETKPWGACDGLDPEGNVFQIAKE
jgi:extradiol dioxygenase family protein